MTRQANNMGDPYRSDVHAMQQRLESLERENRDLLQRNQRLEFDVANVDRRNQRLTIIAHDLLGAPVSRAAPIDDLKQRLAKDDLSWVIAWWACVVALVLGLTTLT